MKASRMLAAGLAIGLAVGAAATGIVLSLPSGEAGRDGPARGARGEYAPAVAMALAEPAALGRTIDVIGEARALKSVSITSEATGLVEEVNIAPGKRVSKGDILLRVDDDQQQVALARARAEYPIAQANAARFRNLLEDKSASAQEAEEALNNFNAVTADLRAAEVAVEQRTIQAPFDGISGITDIEVGDYLRAGDAVTTLDDTSSIVIEFAVPQEAARYIAIDQPVSSRLASGSGLAYEGVVTGIDSRVDSASRTLRVEATFPNPDGGLIPGAVFAITTTSEGEAAVAVPGLAIQWDRAGAYVWKRSGGGRAQRAAVVLLQRTEGTVLVEGEIAPGDAIVSEGADRVRVGVRLPPARDENNAAGVDIAADTMHE